MNQEQQSTNILEIHQRLVNAVSFNNDKYKDAIIPSLYNILMHRKEAAKSLLTSENKEVSEYYDYCNIQISKLLGLPL